MRGGETKTYNTRDRREHELVYAENNFWNSSACVGWLGKDSLKCEVSCEGEALFTDGFTFL